MMVRMPRMLSWFVWGAVVVAGSFVSFQIWKRALEPGHEAVAQAPLIVQPAASRTVRATITEKPSGVASGRGSSPTQGGGLLASSPLDSLAAGSSGGAGTVASTAGGGTGDGHRFVDTW